MLTEKFHNNKKTRSSINGSNIEHALYLKDYDIFSVTFCPSELYDLMTNVSLTSKHEQGVLQILVELGGPFGIDLVPDYHCDIRCPAPEERKYDDNGQP